MTTTEDNKSRDERECMNFISNRMGMVAKPYKSSNESFANGLLEGFMEGRRGYVLKEELDQMRFERNSAYDWVARKVKEAVEMERERCASIAKDWVFSNGDHATEISDLILNLHTTGERAE